MECIFCSGEEGPFNEEHIVNESLVSHHYIIHVVCKACNNLFSKFEQEVLSSSIIGFVRVRMAKESKKGKPAKSKTDVEFVGDAEFRKDHITISRLKADQIDSFDPETGIVKARVAAFKNNEMVAAKFLLKVGFESICKSQNRLFQKYDFRHLKEYLLNHSNLDWPFASVTKNSWNFKPIPMESDQVGLAQDRCHLDLYEKDSSSLIFRFRYGAFTGLINLLNRNQSWLSSALVCDRTASVYPEHIRNQLENGS